VKIPEKYTDRRNLPLPPWKRQQWISVLFFVQTISYYAAQVKVYTRTSLLDATVRSLSILEQ